MKQIFSLLILAVVAIGIFSCGKDNSLEKLRKNELELLNAYIDKYYPEAEPTSSGLYYFEEKSGTGDTIVAGDVVQIFYATWLIDSMLIDETTGYTNGYRYEPMQFTVGGGAVIAGLDEAVRYMQKGSVSNLVINSELAYGQNGNTYGTPPVIGFTTLLMQVEVYKVNGK